MLTRKNGSSTMASKAAGFSLLELMVALTILLMVSAVVMSGLAQMQYTQPTINNRSEWHLSVPAATELMEQEIVQAGRFAIPSGTTYTLGAAVPATSVGLPTMVTLNSSSGSYPGLWNPPNTTSLQQLVVG